MTATTTDQPQTSDYDRQVATTIYRQIGPIVAGNMDAKASRAGAIPGGLRMGGCLMVRRRVDVDVALNGKDLYDVTVVSAPTLKTGGGEVLFETRDVFADQIRALMLDVGDNNQDALETWAF